LPTLSGPENRDYICIEVSWIRAVMLFRVALAALALLAALPAAAADRPRLVLGTLDGGQPGFLRMDGGALHGDLYTRGATRFGALAESSSAMSAPGRDHLTLGGYVTYDLNEYRFGSSLKGGEGAMAAELTAMTAAPLMGLMGNTQLRLGADWTRPQSFSLNAAQPGLAGYDGYQPGGDLSLSLSWTRDVTPSLSLGGVAAATRPITTDTEQQHGGFLLGAGVGYRF
jgi:hypothetical protein